MAAFQASSKPVAQQQQQQQRPPTSPEFGDFLSTTPATAPAQPPPMQAQLLQPQPSADLLLMGGTEPPKPQKVCLQILVTYCCLLFCIINILYLLLNRICWPLAIFFWLSKFDIFIVQFLTEEICLHRWTNHAKFYSAKILCYAL